MAHGISKVVKKSTQVLFDLHLGNSLLLQKQHLIGVDRTGYRIFFFFSSEFRVSFVVFIYQNTETHCLFLTHFLIPILFVGLH